MRTKLRLGAVAALLLVVASLPAAAASPKAALSTDGAGRVEVLRVTAISAIEDVDIDVGDPGFSLGDYFVFNDDLFIGDRNVGVFAGTCTLVGIGEDEATTFHCLGTLDLPAGQITVRTLATFTETTDQIRAAITGGTRRYRTAHGEMILRFVGETESTLTLRIIR